MVARNESKRRPRLLPGGADIYEAPGLNMTKVHAMFATPDAFVSMCQIVREDESSGYLTPTPTQQKLLQAYATNRWLLVDKFRQAKITTVSVMLLLRDCMYLSGVKGLLIAERHDTAEDIFERILYAYNRLPDDVKMPLAKGRKAGTTQIHFCHGGSIKILTAGGRSPAIGRSVDRLIITEFGEAQWQKKAAINIFPTLNKRPNARVILESTPGRAGSHHETMWRASLEGRGRFKPLFLEWWHDDSCRVDATGFKPTNVELEYLELHPGMTMENLAFRRLGLETEMGGDPRLFSSKYPSHPYDGWIGSMAPVMPADVLQPMLDRAVNDPDIGPFGVREIEPPRQDGSYLITADPAGFGASGDKSAVTVFDAISRREVAFWEDRETPDRFARRLLRVQERYNGAMLVVESNAPACITLLKDSGAKRLLWTDRNHPGWYATAKRIQEAEAKLVKMLRERDLLLRSRGLLHQLLNYDGSRKKRVKGLDGTTHHFDRARTAVMAADVLSRRNFTATQLRDEPRNRPAGQVTIGDLDLFRRGKRRGFAKPVPREWM